MLVIRSENCYLNKVSTFHEKMSVKKQKVFLSLKNNQIKFLLMWLDAACSLDKLKCKWQYESKVGKFFLK